MVNRLTRVSDQQSHDPNCHNFPLGVAGLTWEASSPAFMSSIPGLTLEQQTDVCFLRKKVRRVHVNIVLKEYAFIM